MRQITCFCSLLILVAASVGADSPIPPGTKPTARPEVKAKGAEVTPRATVQGQPSIPERPVDARATSLFRSAQNLEKAGKKPGAIGLYRDVLIRYPESPEALESTTKIRALGGKLPTPAEIKPAPPAETANFTRAPKPKYASQEANRAALNQAMGGMVGGAASQPATGGYQNKSPYAR